MKITKNTVIKSLRTFVQTALGYMLVNIAILDFSSDYQVAKSTLIGLVVSAVSSGLCAVMNLERMGENNNDNG